MTLASRRHQPKTNSSKGETIVKMQSIRKMQVFLKHQLAVFEKDAENTRAAIRALQEIGIRMGVTNHYRPETGGNATEGLSRDAIRRGKATTANDRSR